MLKFLILLLPIFLYSQSLKSILEYATKSSDLVVSKIQLQESKSKNVEAKESAYYPTIDIGTSYQTQNKKQVMLPGDIYTGYAKIGFDIYDGGKKSSLLKQSENEYKSSGFDTLSTKKSLSLQIVQDFFNIKSLKSSLSAREEANKSLQEQLIRMQRFYIAKLATKDDVDRLQAAYDTNVYEIESIKFQILSLKQSLELKVGTKITQLDDSRFIEFQKYDIEIIDSVKSLMAKKEALINNARSVESVYYPQIKIEDTYSIYDYDRDGHVQFDMLDKQNTLMLSLNMRIFDNASVSKSKQAIMINSQSLNTQVSYFKKEQEMRYKLSIAAIKTNKLKIKSASSALTSASSAFETISKKYDAGIVDNITYLDALTSQTKAKALYETSLNDLEIAYATYYFYAGKNIEEFLE